LLIFHEGVVCLGHVLVIGAGVSGCTVAGTLADQGVEVTLVEKAHDIGGRVRSYGCKAVDKCQNCGVCLTGGLWDKVLNHQGISVFVDAVIEDITGIPGDFRVRITCGDSSSIEARTFEDINAVVVCTGFESQSSGLSAHLHIEDVKGLITGTKLEELMLERTGTKLFESIPGFETSHGISSAPSSIAFIQCLGSRDDNEGGLYCSRVCCSYSTRAAKVIRSYYPECEIVFFYMELQNVEAGNYFAGLRELGMEFIKCRPLKISSGTPITIEYDDPASGITSREFDLVVLSDGIHAGVDNGRLAEVCRLGQDKDGFLRAVGTVSGIFVTGCARAPMKIDEAYADALTISGEILASLSTTESGVKKT